MVEATFEPAMDWRFHEPSCSPFRLWPIAHPQSRAARDGLGWATAQARRGAARQLLLVLLQLCLPSCALTGGDTRRCGNGEAKLRPSAQCRAGKEGEGTMLCMTMRANESGCFHGRPSKAMATWASGKSSSRALTCAGKGGPSDVHCTPIQHATYITQHTTRRTPADLPARKEDRATPSQTS